MNALRTFILLCSIFSHVWWRTTVHPVKRLPLRWLECSQLKSSSSGEGAISVPDDLHIFLYKGKTRWARWGVPYTVQYSPRYRCQWCKARTTYEFSIQDPILHWKTFWKFLSPRMCWVFHDRSQHAACMRWSLAPPTKLTATELLKCDFRPYYRISVFSRS